MANMLSINRRGASFVDLQVAAADGHAWAVDALIDEFLPRLISFASARGAADPEGIAHVALVSVLHRLGDLHFEAREQMWAYLCRTARSRIIDEFRAAKPVDLVSDTAALHEIGLDHRRAARTSFDDRVVTRDYVDGLLSPLTNEQRQILEMRFFDDLSIEETATRTGRSQDAVKGLQRRAINAIIAAAAVILAFITSQWASGEPDGGPTSNAPADRGAIVEEDAPADDAESADELEGLGESGSPGDSGGPGQSESESQAATVVVEDVDGAGSDVAGEADIDPDADAGPGVVDLDRFAVTVGSERSSELDVSGAIVSEAAHGTRVYCPVSHFAHGDPIAGVQAPGTMPATMFWGNTSASASSSASDIPNVGNGSCEGGINDRSAYWMPGLFDSDGQVVLPEKILVEYKTFGGRNLDRSAVQPIPPGLQLIADATVAESMDSFRAFGGDESITSFAIAFPECVMTDQAGEPVLSSQGDTSHLSYAGAQTASGCPSSHPYRIPQLTYKIDYAVPYGSGWYLSSGFDAESTADRLAAGAISGWDPASMNAMIRCTIELIGNCEFAAVDDGRRVSRSQLPERFDGPDGNRVYRGSVTLTDEADRTPFGSAIPQFS